MLKWLLKKLDLVITPEEAAVQALKEDPIFRHELMEATIQAIQKSIYDRPSLWREHLAKSGLLEVREYHVHSKQVEHRHYHNQVEDGFY